MSTCIRAGQVYNRHKWTQGRCFFCGAEQQREKFFDLDTNVVVSQHEPDQLQDEETQGLMTKEEMTEARLDQLDDRNKATDDLVDLTDPNNKDTI